MEKDLNKKETLAAIKHGHAWKSEILKNGFDGNGTKLTKTEDDLLLEILKDAAGIERNKK